MPPLAIPRPRSISPPVSPDSVVSEAVKSVTRLTLPPRPRSKSPTRPTSSAVVLKSPTGSDKPAIHMPPRPKMSSTTLSFRPSENLRSLQRALDNQTLRYGANHPKIAAIHNQIGNHHFRQGNLEAAKTAYNLAAACDAAGEHRIAAYTNLATVLWRTGEVLQAITILRQALVVNEVEALAEEGKVEESITGASIHHQLGLCYALSSDFDKALIELESAREIRKRVLAHAEVGRTIDAIGKVHSMKGDYDAAIRCHQEALVCLKDAHVSIANTMQNLATAYEKAGNAAEATRCRKEMEKALR